MSAGARRKYDGKLSTDDLARIAEVRAEWMRIGLSTEPCDREAATEAVLRCYDTAGIERPPLVIWMDSPLGGLYASAVLRNLPRTGQLGGQLGGQLADQLRGQLGGQLSPWYDSYWLALYLQAICIAPLQRSERLDALAIAVGTCGWWWPMRGAVVITDRPSLIARDNQFRLHHETGPALLYRDGYSLHAWHGVRVPADLIESGWDTKRILKETNQEVRRAAIERSGWAEARA